MTTPEHAMGTGVSGDGQCVTSLNPNDVLFGRGSGPNDHEGNVLFRRLVRERKTEYMNTNHRQTKAKIAREIVDKVRAKNGRFLKKMDPADAKRMGIPKGADAWCTVDEDTIMEKAKQALRQKAEKEKGDEEDATYNFNHGGDLKPAAAGASPPPSVPVETQSHFAHGTLVAPLVGGYAATSDGMRYNQADQNLNWQTYSGNPDPIAPAYGNAPSSMPLSHDPSAGAMLSEEPPPPQRLADMNHHRMMELDKERLAEMAVHHSAAHDYDEDQEVGDGPEDDERRRSLQVADLMRSFNEMGTSSSSNNMNHESSETMGTIDPLPIGGSNVSMMSSSTFSIFKGALNETPRSSLTRRCSGSRQDSSRLVGAEGSRSHRSGSSDMSISLSNVDAIWGEGNRNSNQISQVVEGNEGEEYASRRSLAVDPRPLSMMEDHPDSMSSLGQSSVTFIKAALGDSGDSSGLMGAEPRDRHEDSSGRLF